METNAIQPDWRQLLGELVGAIHRSEQNDGNGFTGFDDDAERESVCICGQACITPAETEAGDTWDGPRRRWALGRHTPDCPYWRAFETLNPANLVADTCSMNPAREDMFCFHFTGDQAILARRYVSERRTLRIEAPKGIASAPVVSVGEVVMWFSSPVIEENVCKIEVPRPV